VTSPLFLPLSNGVALQQIIFGKRKRLCSRMKFNRQNKKPATFVGSSSALGIKLHLACE